MKQLLDLINSDKKDDIEESAQSTMSGSLSIEPALTNVLTWSEPNAVWASVKPSYSFDVTWSEDTSNNVKWSPEVDMVMALPSGGQFTILVPSFDRIYEIQNLIIGQRPTISLSNVRFVIYKNATWENQLKGYVYVDPQVLETVKTDFITRMNNLSKMNK